MFCSLTLQGPSWLCDAGCVTLPTTATRTSSNKQHSKRHCVSADTPAFQGVVPAPTAAALAAAAALETAVARANPTHRCGEARKPGRGLMDDGWMIDGWMDG